jgi:type IV secretion system protein VirD4
MRAPAVFAPGHVIVFFVLLILAAIIIRALIWAYVPHRKLPGNRVRHNRIRLRLRLHPGRGHATVFELWWRWGRFAAFRRSDRSRRSLSTSQRIAAGAAAWSIVVGRAHYRHSVRVPLEEHVLVMAPPRTGKTGWLARVIMHYPGPVLSTTTRPDVFELTSGLRARRGPIAVFNPQGIGGITATSTFRWSPIDGCEDRAVAIRRADAFANALPQEGENKFFGTAARAYLRAMFHAAALINADMRAVALWARTGTKGGAQEAEEILRRHGAQDWAAELAQLRGKAERTAATNEMVMGQMIGFMSDPALAAAALPGREDLDLATFLRQSGTLYMIADADGNEESPIAPLFAAMAAEVHHVAARIGQASLGGRLDPPLLMALDEIVQVCPVPLPSWLADSGGKGIQIIPVVHGEAQLRTRWKADGARAVMDTCGVKVWLPGITDTATLETASKLCGKTAFREKGEERHSRHEVMTPDMVRQLPDLFALVVRGGLSPVVTRLPLAWKDKAYRRARRGGWAVYRTPARWAEPLPVPGIGPDWARPAPEMEAPEPASDHSDDFAWTGRRP